MSRSPLAPRHVRLVALDIAGTTVDEGGRVYQTLTDAVVRAGAHPTSADVVHWMGADKREAVAGLLPGLADRVDAAFADLRERLQAAYAQRPPTPVPGVPEALALLRDAGVRVALTTGFDRDVTEGLLRGLGWDHDVVDAVVCVDDVAAGRPAPYLIFRAMEATSTSATREVVVVGDTSRDVEAGLNAGAGAVLGVLTGAGDRAGLSGAGATAVLDSVAALPAWLGVG